jgi:multiple sugar transport system permease protein
VRPRKSAYLFLAPYVLLLAVVGIYPVGYAIRLAVTSLKGHFSGVTNFVKAWQDPEFLPAFAHVGAFLVIWLSALVVLVVGMSLILHSLDQRISAAFRFVFYLPAALAGSASVMLWLFMLQPGVSPWTFVLHSLGYHTLGDSLSTANLPVVFALIAFWSGAGSWIVVMYGALATIPPGVLEAARLDGAGPWRTAFRIKLPLIRRWVAYMLIGAFAAGTQLFAEPQLVSEATGGILSQTWSPNQLAYYLSFQLDNFNYAAAISMDLLLIAVISAAVILFRTGLFKVSE